MSPGLSAISSLDGGDHGAVQLAVPLVFLVHALVPHLDGIATARHLDDRSGPRRWMAKWALNRSASIVADVMMSRNSGRLGSSRLM